VQPVPGPREDLWVRVDRVWRVVWRGLKQELISSDAVITGEPVDALIAECGQMMSAAAAGEAAPAGPRPLLALLRLGSRKHFRRKQFDATVPRVAAGPVPFPVPVLEGVGAGALRPAVFPVPIPGAGPGAEPGAAWSCHLVLAMDQATREHHLGLGALLAHELACVHTLHYAILEAIARVRGKGITGVQLAGCLGWDPMQLSRELDALVELGLVARQVFKATKKKRQLYGKKSLPDTLRFYSYTRPCYVNDHDKRIHWDITRQEICTMLSSCKNKTAVITDLQTALHRAYVQTAVFDTLMQDLQHEGYFHVFTIKLDRTQKTCVRLVHDYPGDAPRVCTGKTPLTHAFQRFIAQDAMAADANADADAGANSGTQLLTLMLRFGVAQSTAKAVCGQLVFKNLIVSSKCDTTGEFTLQTRFRLYAHTDMLATATHGGMHIADNGSVKVKDEPHAKVVPMGLVGTSGRVKSTKVQALRRMRLVGNVIKKEIAVYDVFELRHRLQRMEATDLGPNVDPSSIRVADKKVMKRILSKLVEDGTCKTVEVMIPQTDSSKGAVDKHTLWISSAVDLQSNRLQEITAWLKRTEEAKKKKRVAQYNNQKDADGDIERIDLSHCARPPAKRMRRDAGTGASPASLVSVPKKSFGSKLALHGAYIPPPPPSAPPLLPPPTSPPHRPSSSLPYPPAQPVATVTTPVMLAPVFPVVHGGQESADSPPAFAQRAGGHIGEMQDGELDDSLGLPEEPCQLGISTARTESVVILAAPMKTLEQPDPVTVVMPIVPKQALPSPAPHAPIPDYGAGKTGRRPWKGKMERLRYIHTFLTDILFSMAEELSDQASSGDKTAAEHTTQIARLGDCTPDQPSAPAAASSRYHQNAKAFHVSDVCQLLTVQQYSVFCGPQQVISCAPEHTMTCLRDLPEPTKEHFRKSKPEKRFKTILANLEDILLLRFSNKEGDAFQLARHICLTNTVLKDPLQQQQPRMGECSFGLTSQELIRKFWRQLQFYETEYKHTSTNVLGLPASTNLCIVRQWGGRDIQAGATTSTAKRKQPGRDMTEIRAAAKSARDCKKRVTLSAEAEAALTSSLGTAEEEGGTDTVGEVLATHTPAHGSG